MLFSNSLPMCVSWGPPRGEATHERQKDEPSFDTWASKIPLEGVQKQVCPSWAPTNSS